MCQEVRKIKSDYNYDFENLLIDQQSDMQEDINKKNKAIEQIAEYFTTSIVKNNSKIERIIDHPFAQPIVAIAKHLGFVIFKGEFENLTGQNSDYRDASGMITIDGQLVENFGSDKVLVINPKENLGHRRFTIAHELAHYLFDFNETKQYRYVNFYRTNEVSNQVEIRASRFAALLMPVKLFKERYTYLTNSKNITYYELVNKLADEFQVSPTAIVRRIDELSELGELEYDR